MMKHYFIPFFFAISILSAQEAFKKHQVFLSIDFSKAWKIDKTYSRLPKQGTVFGGFIGYEYQNPKYIVSTQANFFMGTLETATNTLNKVKPSIGGELFVKYLRKVSLIKSPKIKSYIGGRYVLRADLWFPLRNVFRYGWDLNTGLDLSARVRYQWLTKLSVQYETDLHLIGVLYRPHNNGQQLSTEKLQLEKGYLATATENPYFSTPLNSFYWNNRLGLYYRFNPSWKVFFLWQLDYLNLSPPLVKKGFTSHQIIGISFNF